MRIEIDTLRDSQQDIRKAIEMLQSLVAHPIMQRNDLIMQQSRNVFENTSSPSNAQSLFGALFDAPAHETKKDEPKIEYYR